MHSPESVILLPEIDSLERTPDGLSLQFVVPADLGYFAGHFPEVPLLPGVVQIGWAVELARQHVPFDARFRSLAGVKFMRVIQPGATVALQLAFDEDRSELAFEYRSDGLPCSGGRVRFAEGTGRGVAGLGSEPGKEEEGTGRGVAGLGSEPGKEH